MATATPLWIEMLSGWQPIATVPYHEPVLVYNPDDDLIYVAVWAGNHWRGRYWLDPSHWMHLPLKPVRRDHK